MVLLFCHYCPCCYALQDCLLDFLMLMKDSDRHVRKAAVVALSAVVHHKPGLVAAGLEQLLPELYDQTVIKPEMVSCPPCVCSTCHDGVAVKERLCSKQFPGNGRHVIDRFTWLFVLCCVCNVIKLRCCLHGALLKPLGAPQRHLTAAANPDSLISALWTVCCSCSPVPTEPCLLTFLAPCTHAQVTQALLAESSVLGSARGNCASACLLLPTATSAGLAHILSPHRPPRGM